MKHSVMNVPLKPDGSVLGDNHWHKGLSQSRKERQGAMDANRFAGFGAMQRFFYLLSSGAPYRPGSGKCLTEKSLFFKDPQSSILPSSNF